MAYLDGDAILDSIRAVLEDGVGSIRPITADTYDPGIHEGMTRGAEAVRSLSKPRVEASIPTVETHPASPPQPGNIKLLAITIEVRLVRSFTATEALDDDTRQALRGAAATDADRVSQALSYPGNLTLAPGAVATGIVSGCLIHTGSTTSPIEFDDGQSGRLVSIHTFSATVLVSPAIS